METIHEPDLQLLGAEMQKLREEILELESCYPSGIEQLQLKHTKLDLLATELQKLMLGIDDDDIERAEAADRVRENMARGLYSKVRLDDSIPFVTDGDL